MAAGTFRIAVVTPEREVLATEAKFVAFPAYDGEMGVLAGRAPILARLGSGRLRVEPAAGGTPHELFISGGFAQMVDDKLTLLTEEAREIASISPVEAAQALAAASGLPGQNEAESIAKDRALDRARTLRRLAD